MKLKNEPASHLPVRERTQPYIRRALIVSVLWMTLGVAFGQTCVATITSSPPMPVYPGEPVTFTVNSGFLAVSSWETTTASYNVGFLGLGNILGGLLTLGYNSITFNEGFDADEFIVADLVGPLGCCGCTTQEFYIEIQNYTNTIEFENDDIVVDDNHAEVDCSTELPIVITAISTGPYNADASIHIWQSKTLGQDEWVDIATGPQFSISERPSESFYLRKIISHPGHPNSTSNELFIEVVNKPQGGFIAGNSEFCQTASFTELTLSGHFGPVVQWEVSFDSDPFSFSPVAGAGMLSLIPLDIPGTHNYRVKIEIPGCDPVYSTGKEINVYPPVDNDIITPDQYLCENEIPQTIVANSPTGGGEGSYSITWQKKEEGEPFWDNVPGQPTNEIQFSLPLSETTHFKRIDTSDKGCSSSDSTTIHVTSLSYAGNFTDAGQEICPGEIAETVSVEN